MLKLVLRAAKLSPQEDALLKAVQTSLSNERPGLRISLSDAIRYCITATATSTAPGTIAVDLDEKED